MKSRPGDLVQNVRDAHLCRSIKNVDGTYYSWFAPGIDDDRPIDRLSLGIVVTAMREVPWYGEDELYDVVYVLHPEFVGWDEDYAWRVMQAINTVFFVSGHLTLSDEEWEAHYVNDLKQAIAVPGARFVLAEARGADTRAQQWLHENGVADVTVYHMFDSPRINVGGWPTVGGFTTDEARDEAMTAASTDDIAWVRPGREKSGTASNLTRRRDIAL